MIVWRLNKLTCKSKLKKNLICFLILYNNILDDLRLPCGFFNLFYKYGG